MSWLALFTCSPGPAEEVRGRVRWRVGYLGNRPTSVAFYVDGVLALETQELEVLLDTRQVTVGAHALLAVGTLGAFASETQVTVTVAHEKQPDVVDGPLAEAT